MNSTPRVATPPVLRQVVDVLDRLYPAETAFSWDRVGLVTGDMQQPVRRIHVAVDPTLAVIEEARDLGADMLITHHPLLLRGVSSVATTTAKGAAVTALIVADIALYCAHTNADVASPGVCDALAEAVGLSEVRPLTVQEGQDLGRIGTLAAPMSLAEFASAVAAALPSAPVGIRVAGPPTATVSSVAVLGGSGDSLFEAVRAAGADVYLTADLRHHPALEAREESRGGPPYLIDAGHWASEWLWLERAIRDLREGLGDEHGEVEVYHSRLCTDPWDFVVGAKGPQESATNEETP